MICLRFRSRGPKRALSFQNCQFLNTRSLPHIRASQKSLYAWSSFDESTSEVRLSNSSSVISGVLSIFRTTGILNNKKLYNYLHSWKNELLSINLNYVLAHLNKYLYSFWYIKHISLVETCDTSFKVSFPH